QAQFQDPERTEGQERGRVVPAAGVENHRFGGFSNQPIPEAPSGPNSRRDQEGLYRALWNRSPSEQTQELASLLHWTRGEKPAGKSTTLQSALASVPTTRRRSVVHAFWAAREEVARLQMLNEHADRLRGMRPMLLQRRHDRTGAQDMLSLQLHLLDAQASILECKARLATSRFHLTHLAGGSLQGDWMWPDTPPHAGGYRPHLTSSADPDGVYSRMANRVLEQWGELQRSASDLIQADARQAREGVADSARGTAPTLQASRKQIAETSRMLSQLTAYNQAIADFALSVMPSETPAEAAVQSLVLPQQPADETTSSPR
ncbi:MAG: hypothetical protein N2C14_02940, partial [Planctomycetales bacterium]